MKIISHRGNIDGPIVEKENHPEYIDYAASLGYEVEVDLRFYDGKFWLGHDEPQYQIDVRWILDRIETLWIHCKNQECAIKLLQLNNRIRFFCHSFDKFVLTSNGFLWVHDLDSLINEKCIIPLISEDDILCYRGQLPGFVCTDFVNKINLI